MTGADALTEIDTLIEHFARAGGRVADLKPLEEFLSGRPTTDMTSRSALWRAPSATTEQPNQRRDDHRSISEYI